MLTLKMMRTTGNMRGLSLSYCATAQKLARFGAAFGAGLARLRVGFHPADSLCAPFHARTAIPRSYDPSPQARIAPNACDPCPFSSFLVEMMRPALSFADAAIRCGIYFSYPAFFGKLWISITQQRAVKSCVNHFLQSPSFPSQPSQAVWTMTQNAPSLAALLVRLLPTRQVAMPQRALLLVQPLARCATTQAFVTKTTPKDLALGAPVRALAAHEKQGFRAGPLGSLFSCA